MIIDATMVKSIYSSIPYITLLTLPFVQSEAQSGYMSVHAYFISTCVEMIQQHETNSQTNCIGGYHALLLVNMDYNCMRTFLSSWSILLCVLIHSIN